MIENKIKNGFKKGLVSMAALGSIITYSQPSSAADLNKIYDQIRDGKVTKQEAIINNLDDLTKEEMKQIKQFNPNAKTGSVSTDQAYEKVLEIKNDSSKTEAEKLKSYTSITGSLEDSILEYDKKSDDFIAELTNGRGLVNLSGYNYKKNLEETHEDIMDAYSSLFKISVEIGELNYANSCLKRMEEFNESIKSLNSKHSSYEHARMDAQSEEGRIRIYWAVVKYLSGNEEEANKRLTNGTEMTYKKSKYAGVNKFLKNSMSEFENECSKKLFSALQFYKKITNQQTSINRDALKKDDANEKNNRGTPKYETNDDKKYDGALDLKF